MKEKTGLIKRVNIYQKKLPNFITSAMQAIFTTFIVCLVCVIIFSFVYIYVPVDGYSMYPTLNEDYSDPPDSVYINKFSSYTYQDIIVVKKQDNGKIKYVIKRLIAKGGDKVAITQIPSQEDPTQFFYTIFLIKKGTTERIILSEPYLSATCNMQSAYNDFLNLDVKYPTLDFAMSHDDQYNINVIYLTIPEYCVFYLGDNRGTGSEDCSDYGPVDEVNVVGKVDIIVKNSSNNFYQIANTYFHKIFG